MTESNARFEDLPDGSRFETLSPSIFINYDPITETGGVMFQASRYLMVDGAYRTDVPGIPAGSVATSFADILSRCFIPEGVTDPITGADLSGISGAGTVLIIKAAFDALWNERQPPQAT